MRNVAVPLHAASITSSAIGALARYRSNACSGVSTFAILDRSPRFAPGILKPAAAFGAAVALTGRLARLVVLRVDFGDDFLAMVNAPLFGFWSAPLRRSRARPATEDRVTY